MRRWLSSCLMAGIVSATADCGDANSTAPAASPMCTGSHCGQVVVRWASQGVVFTGGAPCSACRSTQGTTTVSTTTSRPIENTETLRAPGDRYSLVLTVRPCDANCGHLGFLPSTCRAPVDVAAAHPQSALVAVSARACQIRVFSGYGGDPDATGGRPWTRSHPAR